MQNEIFKRIISSFVIVPIALFFIIKGTFFFIFFMSIFFLVNSYEWIQMTKKKSYLIPGIIFLFFSSISAYLLRGTDGTALLSFILVILICVSTDIGGYVFGKIFKGPKLIKISPNKTYAGMFGGFFLSIISANIYVNNLDHLASYLYISVEQISKFNTLDDLIYVLLISLVSQIGDIILSFFKRKSKIKNTGKLLPGHGGLLDRVDGMIFAIPFIYLLQLYSNLT